MIDDVLRANGVDADAVFAEIASRRPARDDPQGARGAVNEHRVWGVPTFIADDLQGDRSRCSSA